MVTEFPSWLYIRHGVVYNNTNIGKTPCSCPLPASILQIMDILKRLSIVERKPTKYIPTINCIKTCVIMVLLLVHDADGQECRRSLVRMKITHERCVPLIRRLPTCVGMCRSYSRPSADPGHSGEMAHQCQCCTADDQRNVTLNIRCLDPARRIFTIHHKRVIIPRSCRCRPCTETPEIHEQKRSTDYLEQSLNTKSKSSNITLGQLIAARVPVLYKDTAHFDISDKDID